MIEVLGPVISLCRLVTDALAHLTKRKGVREVKRIKRELVETQVRLKTLVDDSEKLLTVLRTYRHQTVSSPETMERISTALERVRDSTRAFYWRLHWHSDDVQRYVLDTMAPHVHKDMTRLTLVRGDLLDQMIVHMNRVKADDNETLMTVNPPLLEWDHRAFLTDPDYVSSVLDSMRNRWAPIAEAIEQYELVVCALRRCSEDLSALLRSQLTLNELVEFRNRLKQSEDSL